MTDSLRLLILPCASSILLCASFILLCASLILLCASLILVLVLCFDFALSFVY